MLEEPMEIEEDIMAVPTNITNSDRKSNENCDRSYPVLFLRFNLNNLRRAENDSDNMLCEAVYYTPFPLVLEEIFYVKLVLHSTDSFCQKLHCGLSKTSPAVLMKYFEAPIRNHECTYRLLKQHYCANLAKVAGDKNEIEYAVITKNSGEVILEKMRSNIEVKLGKMSGESLCWFYIYVISTGSILVCANNNPEFDILDTPYNSNKGKEKCIHKRKKYSIKKIPYLSWADGYKKLTKLKKSSNKLNSTV